MNRALTKDEYLKKSKNQKTAAAIMLGGGGALVLTSCIIPNGKIPAIPSYWEDQRTI